MARSPSQEGAYELHGLNLETLKERTLFQNFFFMSVPIEISGDDAWVATVTSHDGSLHLSLISLDGNEVYDLHPAVNQPVAVNYGFIQFLKPTRGEGDPGRLLFSADSNIGVRQLNIADLTDFHVSKAATGEVVNENIDGFRMAPDSKTLIFRRNSPQGARMYSLDLNSDEAQPVFLNLYANSGWTFSSDGSSLIYASTGEFYPRNQIIQTRLDGKQSVVLSLNLNPEWLKPEDTVTLIKTSQSRVVLAISQLTLPPGSTTTKVISFETTAK
jgi:hypothetical protein